MNDTPEAVRERVLAEELAKGSDPRVAEGRSKAAEMRAKEGLPIDPHQAWPLKLERAGREVSTPPPPAAIEPPAQEAPPEPPVAEQAPVVQEQAPSPTAVAEPPSPVDIGPVEVPVPFDPEVGKPIAADDGSVMTIGGIQVRDSAIPAWLVAILVLIPLWAAFYLVAIGTGDVERATTGCAVHQDRSFECFLPDGEGPAGGVESGGH